MRPLICPRRDCAKFHFSEDGTAFSNEQSAFVSKVKYCFVHLAAQAATV
jgi:hypothetical protein